MEELTSTTFHLSLESSNSQLNLSELGPNDDVNGNTMREGLRGAGVPSQFDLYFDDDPEDQDEKFDRSRSEWHEMLSAPLFTSSVLDCVNKELNSGNKVVNHADNLTTRDQK